MKRLTDPGSGHSLSRTTSGVLLAIAGIVFFSSKAVFVKYAYSIYPVQPLTLLALRMVFALPIYLLILWRSKVAKPGEVKSSDYFWLIVLGALGYYLASFTDFLGLQYIKAGLERIILFTYPTFVLILNRLVFKIRVSPAQIIAILVTYFGVLITFYFDTEIGGQQILLGSSLVLVSAVTYAIFISGSGWLMPKFGPRKFTAISMSTACFCVLLHFLILNGSEGGYLPFSIYVIGFLIAMVATVIPSFLVSMAIDRIGSGRFSIVAGIGPFSTILLASIFLGEKLGPIQILGTVVVIFGILLSREKRPLIT